MLTELGEAHDVSFGVKVLQSAHGSSTHIASKLEVDELDGIVGFVSGRFPGSPRADVETLVTEAFQYLKARATVTAHLIPLTLNRSLRLMRELTNTASQDTDAVQRCALSRHTG